MRVGVTQFAVLVDAAREQVVQQSSLHELQLGDERFGLLDDIIDSVEYFGDPALFGERGKRKSQL